MNNALIIDGVLLLILILGYLLGAHRGLFKSLMGFLTVFLALIGAVLIAGALTEPLTDFAMPIVEERVTERLGIPQDMTMGQFFSGMASSDSTKTPTFSEWFGKLDKWGAGDRFFGEFKDSTVNAAQTAARALVASVIHTVLLLLWFAILYIAIKLLTRTLDHVFDLPVLKTLNDVGGGILGLLEALLLVYLALWLLPNVGVTALRENVENTYVLKFFSTYTPLTLIAALTGGK